MILLLDPSGSLILFLGAKPKERPVTFVVHMGSNFMKFCLAVVDLR